MTELHDLTALEQASAIRRRETSPTELVEHYEARASRLDELVGAFVTRTPELALEMAREAERRLGAGLDHPSPLLGVPVPIKDLHLVAGVRTRLGSRAFDLVSPADDNAVVRLREAGVVFTGKTNTPEFGLPCYTESEIAPPARTPWDLRRNAGGSSGGAAAAVAAGLAPVALGSDGGGSIRIPASCCGLVGIKPSRGRVSSGPLRDPIGDLPVIGPLARTVRDAAALLDAMTGAFPGDPYIAPPLPPNETFLAAADRPPGRLRIGRYVTPVTSAEAHVDPECLRAYESTSALLEDLGHEVVDVPTPFGSDAVEQFEVLWSVLSTLIPVDPALEDQLMPLTRWLRDRGRAFSGVQLATAVSMMRFMARGAMEATAAYDVVLTPTLAQLPALVGGIRDDADPASDFDEQKRFTPWTAAYNVTGQPAMSLPLYWTAAGLPVGVQLVGRPFGETGLISLGAQLEEARPWAHRRPALW